MDVIVTTPPKDVVIETELLGKGDFGVVFKGYALKSWYKIENIRILWQPLREYASFRNCMHKNEKFRSA